MPQVLYRRAKRLVLDPPGGRLAMVGPRTARFVTNAALRGMRAPLYPDPPSPRPTPGLALQVAMDEAVLAVMKSPKRYPRRPDYHRLGDEVRSGTELFEERGWIDAPLGYHRTPPPLVDPASAAERSLGTRYEHLSFPSEFEPRPEEPGRDRWLALEANRTAHAFVLRHRGSEPRPWLVCIHGFGMGKPMMDFTAFKVRRLHRDLGLNLVLPVLPTHGPRASGGFSGTEMMGFDLINAVHGLTQAVWDIRRLITWVRAQGATSVGLYGISLGGYTTALTAGIEDDLDLAIAAIPPSDLPALVAHHAPASLRRRAQHYRILGEHASHLHRVVSPLAIAPKVPRRGRHIVAGLGDRMSTPKQAYRLWQHWDRPNLGWYAGNHVGFFWSRQAEQFVADALAASGFGPASAPSGRHLTAVGAAAG
jgi:dienelactone hydrolase